MLGQFVTEAYTVECYLVFLLPRIIHIGQDVFNPMWKLAFNTESVEPTSLYSFEHPNSLKDIFPNISAISVLMGVEALLCNFIILLDIEVIVIWLNFRVLSSLDI